MDNQHMQNLPTIQKPSAAFIGASWAALGVGVIAFLIGLYNAEMQLNEKGYYFTVLMFGLFASISLQKSVRDRAENIPTTDLYYGICWTALIMSVILITVGLWNAMLTLSEKGFYGMSFVLSLFAAVAVQKNVRDLALFEGEGSSSGSLRSLLRSSTDASDDAV